VTTTLRPPIRSVSSHWKGGTHLSATATETIILGPGDIALAHGPDDAVPVSELVQVAQLYADLARRLD
jgi:acetylornithine deacetylase/succinyl-diaminopimelate desuccinylase-like protein